MRITMSITDARRKLGRLLDRVERGERIIVTRYGKPFVAFIPVADREFLEQSKPKIKKQI